MYPPPILEPVIQKSILCVIVQGIRWPKEKGMILNQSHTNSIRKMIYLASKC